MRTSERFPVLWFVEHPHDIAIWWWRQMKGLVPEPLRVWDQPAAGWALTDLSDSEDTSELALAAFRNGHETECGRFSLTADSGRAISRLVARQHLARTAVLRPRGGTVLDCTVTLPIAAEPNLAHVLEYEIDRVTPFRASEVFWTWNVTQRDPAHDRLAARLSFVPKRSVGTLLSIAEQADLIPTRVEAVSFDGETRSIPLTTTMPPADQFRARAARILCWLCLALIGGIVGAPLLQQSLALGHVDAQIEAMKPSVVKAEALRRAIVQPSAAAKALADARAETGAPVPILAALTIALPDDTFLISFSMKRHVISIEGRSASAARLISLLSANPAISNPHFVAPVMRQGDSDAFSIQANASP